MLRWTLGLVLLAFAISALEAQGPAQKVQQQQQKQAQAALKKLQAELAKHAKKAEHEAKIHAPKNGKQPKAKGKGKAGDKNADVQFSEAEALKQAYVLLAGADHDYKGHRVKAMHAVHAAYHQLDNVVNKKGTAQQKAKSQQEDALAAAAKEAAKMTPKVHEVQPLSDAQLAQAAQILFQVHGALAQNHQPRVLQHVEVALTEIATALRIN